MEMEGKHFERKLHRRYHTETTSIPTNDTTGNIEENIITKGSKGKKSIKKNKKYTQTKETDISKMAKANEDVLGLQTPSNGTVTQNSIGDTTPCCGISAQIAQSLDRLTLSVNELKADIKELKEVKTKVDHVQTLQHCTISEN